MTTHLTRLAELIEERARLDQQLQQAQEKVDELEDAIEEVTAEIEALEAAERPYQPPKEQMAMEIP